jgi:hypothetical protein
MLALEVARWAWVVPLAPVEFLARVVRVPEREERLALVGVMLAHGPIPRSAGMQDQRHRTHPLRCIRLPTPSRR